MGLQITHIRLEACVWGRKHVRKVLAHKRSSNIKSKRPVLPRPTCLSLHSLLTIQSEYRSLCVEDLVFYQTSTMTAQKSLPQKAMEDHQDELGHVVMVEQIAVDTLRNNITAQYSSRLIPHDVGYRANLRFRLVNPLAGVSKDDLMRQVEHFAVEKDLLDILPILQKGACVAQASVPLAEVEELEPDELDCLQHELKHRWTHPFALYATVFMCSIGAAVQYV